MKHIFQQFVAWATNLQQSEFERAAIKLTLYYVAGTFLILVVSSAALLFLYTPAEPVAMVVDGQEFEQEHDEWGMEEFREHLLGVIVVIDLMILLVVSGFAYMLARRTLRPIKYNQERQLAFMGTVAHELRTPLSVMRAGSDTMLRKDRSAADYKDFIHDVNEESERLTRLSNQLLQLLKGVSTHTELAMCDVSQLVEKEVSWMQSYAKTRNVELHTDVQPHITLTADRDGLVQVLQNLLKNAIDYNRVEGQVRVTLKQIDSHVVQLIVQDTGVGIPADKHVAVFERFETLNAARTQGVDTGAGLGLSIVKEIIEAHSGTVAVASTPGSGTTITVSLPILPS